MKSASAEPVVSPGKCKRPGLAQHIHHIELVAPRKLPHEAEAMAAASPAHIVEPGETRTRELGGGIRLPVEK